MTVLDPEATGDSTVRGLVYELRPWQWYKQLIIYIAVVYSGSAVDVTAWAAATAGAVLFSAIAGSTYILNDVKDREADREHPRKRHRPIASGQVAPSVGVSFAVIVYAVAGTLSWYLEPMFFALVALYVGLNLLYTFGLKSHLFVDLFSISAGFVIRAVAGVVLIAVETSPWLLLCTFLAALMLGVAKRWGEHQATSDPTTVRESLGEYSEQMLQFLLGTVATMLLMAYALYTFFASSLTMMITIPFAFYAVFRFVYLTFEADGSSDPVFLLLDRPSLINFLAWGVTTLFVLYRPEIGVPT